MSRVLVVDDDEAVRQVVSTLIDVERGWSVETSAGGVEARERLADESLPIPDLIVLDVMMPVVDGFQLLSWLREQERLYDIPVVMLTARTTFDDESEGWQRGCDAYVRKPFNADDLLETLDLVLDAGPELRIARRHGRLAEVLELVSSGQGPEPTDLG